MFNLFIKVLLILFTICWTYLFGYNLARLFILFKDKRKAIILNYKEVRNDIYFGLFSSITMVVANAMLIAKVLK